MSQYPALRTIMAGYFHQDWQFDNEDWRDVITTIRKENPNNFVQDVIAQAKMLLDSSSRLGDQEAALAVEIFGDLGSSYDPRITGLSLRDWLLEIVAILQTQE